MKKIISFIMAVLMLCALCVPASAETELRGEISGTHTCDDAVFIDSDVTVASGASVTFNNILVITNESTFIIESDATVTINGILFIENGCQFELYGKLVRRSDSDLCFDAALDVCGDGEIIVCSPASAPAGSTLSEGSLTIVCTVAGVAVGMAVMFFIMKKKKPAAANSADDE